MATPAEVAERWWSQAAALPGSPSAAALAVSAVAWQDAARDLAAAGAQLLALWASSPLGSTHRVRAAFLLQGGRLLVLALPMPDPDVVYPGLQQLFPAASRMQRAVHDLNGIRSDDPDRRPWLRHAAWPEDVYPLRAGGAATVGIEPALLEPDHYAFVRVTGDGVHEIPVGPVHAGIIEPGHFRFSIVGEKVLRLEERLGYVHKGIEQRFQQLPLREGHRLAARISGDSAVAFSWAYCQALEGLAPMDVPPRALWLRALCLESERIQNHLGDLGALGNDAGFAFGLAQFSRLKEEWLRALHAALGQRYLLDAIVPGGCAVDCSAAAAALLAATARHLASTARELRTIYDEHAGVRDRFIGAGQVSPALAQRLGLIGLAGRASGQDRDLRVDRPWAPYADLAPVRCLLHDGDVAARVALRFDELQESCRLVERLLAGLPVGPARAELPSTVAAGLAIGLIEGWRGPVLVALETDGDDGGGGIRRCHPHDCSWQNWPVLEHAIIGNIVPDFPLINKSFNLSYSGHDL